MVGPIILGICVGYKNSNCERGSEEESAVSGVLKWGKSRSLGGGLGRDGVEVDRTYPPH